MMTSSYNFLSVHELRKKITLIKYTEHILPRLHVTSEENFAILMLNIPDGVCIQGIYFSSS
jgi:hypothetical protein